jgi:hypothetical protein
MTTGSAAVRAPSRRLSPELGLAVLGLLTFALIPVHINTIYSGLPAHPLFLHVPVILIPVAVIAALVLVVRPRWFAGHGVWVALVAIVSLGASNLTMGAGKALRNDLHLNGGFGPAALVARHAHAASILRILLIAFTAVLIVSVAVFRTADRRVTGIGLFDAPLATIRSTIPLSAALRVLLAGLAVACAYFVFHTGDLGAKAVWQGRIGGGNRAGFFPGGGGGGGGGPSSLFSPSGG